MPMIQIFFSDLAIIVVKFILLHKGHKVKKNYKKIVHMIQGLGKIKLIFLVYTLIIVLSSLLLYLPLSHNKDSEVVFYTNSLFLAASAFSDTGLSVQNLEKNWNAFGQAVVATLILIGGFGFFAIKIYIFNFVLNQKFSTFSSSLIEAERGGLSVGSTKKTVTVSLSVLLIMVLLSSIILTFIFYFSEGLFNEKGYEKLFVAQKSPQYNFSKSLKYGIFHTISAINNAGFDIIGENSIQEYYYNYGLQILFIILFFIGGVGYPVIYDVYMKIQSRINKKEVYKLSLFSRISLITYLAVSVFGCLTIFFMEYFNQKGFFSDKYERYGSTFSRIFAIFFNSLSTRSAGFATINMNDFQSSSKGVLAILMFIGAAPFSTAGGLRTTTFAVIIMAIISKMRGRKNIEIFKRKIAKDTIQQATSVFAFSILLITCSSLILQLIVETTLPNSNISGYDVLFEICSAFGTAGLSTGLTYQINEWGKFLLIFLMFIGQFGLSSTLFVFRRSKFSIVEYPNHKIPIA